VEHTAIESLAPLESTYVRTIQEAATKTWQQLSHTTMTMTHQLSDVYDPNFLSRVCSSMLYVVVHVLIETGEYIREFLSPSNQFT
jgi:hypothetical protein